MAVNLHPDADDDGRDIDDLVGGALVNLIGKLGRLARSVFLWFVALLFGAEILGLYSLAWSVVFTVSRIGRFGLQRGVPRFVLLARATTRPQGAEAMLAAALQVGLAASLPLAAGLAWLAPLLAGLFDQPQLVPAIRLMAACIPLLTATSVFVEATRALRIMRFGVYVYSMAGPLLLLAGGLVAAAMGAGLQGLAWAQVCMAAGMGILALTYCGRYFHLPAVGRALVTAPPSLQMARFCLPVMLTDVFHALLLRLDIFMLGAYLDADDIGVYSAAQRLGSALHKVPQAFDPIFSPIVSELVARGWIRRLGPRFAALVRWILSIDLVFLGAFVLSGKAILRLFGTEFTAGSDALILLATAATLQGVGAPAEAILIMGGRPGLNLLGNLIWLSTTFLFNILLIPPLGVVGAALAATLAAVCVTLLRLGAVYRTHHIHPFRWSQIKPVSAAAVAGGVTWLMLQLVERVLPGVAWMELAGLVAFVPLYVGGLYVLGLEPEDRALARRLLARRQRAAPADRLQD